MVLEKTLESPLDYEEIQPVHPKGDQSWVFIGRKDAKAETLVLWPPHEKSWLLGKDTDAGRDWGQEEKGTTEDVMAGWHHRLDGREFEWTPGVGDREAWRESRAWLSEWTEREKKIQNYIEIMISTSLKKHNVNDTSVSGLSIFFCLVHFIILSKFSTMLYWNRKKNS